MLQRWVAIACISLSLGACAKAQLNYNTLELATSVGEVIDQQIVYNLSRSLFEGAGFTPSQVQMGPGGANTTNTVNPSLTIPFGAAVATPTALGGLTGYTYAAPSLTIGATNTAVQNWTITPVNDAAQLARLRSLYNFATARMPEGDFKCEYPVQSLTLPLKGPGSNAAWLCSGGRWVYGDPNFVRGHTCVVCAAEPLGTPKALKEGEDVAANPKLIWGLVSDQNDSAHNFKIGSYNGKSLYVCQFCEAFPRRDGKKALSDLTIFVYEALLAPSAGAGGGDEKAAAKDAGRTPSRAGSGKASTITPYFYAIPLR